MAKDIGTLTEDDPGFSDLGAKRKRELQQTLPGFGGVTGSPTIAEDPSKQTSQSQAPSPEQQSISFDELRRLAAAGKLRQGPSSIKPQKQPGLVEGFGTGFKSGLHNVSATMAGVSAVVADKVFNSRTMKNKFVKSMSESLAKAADLGAPYQVESISEANARELGGLISFGLGQTSPFMIESFASALAGGVVGFGAKTAVKQVVKKIAQKEVLDDAEKSLLGNSVKSLLKKSAASIPGGKAGAATGLALESIYQGIGQGFIETGDSNEALKVALPFAASELIGEAVPIAGALKTGVKLGTRIVGTTAASAIAEGATEVGQERLLQQAKANVDPGFNPNSPEAIEALKQSALLGAVAGGLLGGGASLVGGVKQSVTDRKKAPKVVEGESTTPLTREKEIRFEAAEIKRERATKNTGPVPEEVPVKTPFTLDELMANARKDAKKTDEINPPEISSQEAEENFVQARDGGANLDDLIQRSRQPVDESGRSPSEILSEQIEADRAKIADKKAKIQEKKARKVFPEAPQDVGPLSQFSETPAQTQVSKGKKFKSTPKTSTAKIGGSKKVTENAPAQASSTPSTNVRNQQEIRTAADQAATSPKNNIPQPTEAQKKAGNYKKGKVKVNDLDISVENPKGSTRSGVDSDQKPWKVNIKNDYGYIRGTVGKDKDHVDVTLGPNAADTSLPVFVVDQRTPGGKFDEHKVIMGARTLGEAKEIYSGNFTSPELANKLFGDVTVFEQDQFKKWVFNKNNTKKPSAVFSGDRVQTLKRKSKLFQQAQRVKAELKKRKPQTFDTQPRKMDEAISINEETKSPEITEMSQMNEQLNQNLEMDSSASKSTVNSVRNKC